MSIKLKENEKIYFTIRRYGLTLFWWWLLIFLLISIPFFFMFWLFQNGWWGITLFVLPVAIALILLIRSMYLWRKNCLFITSHRLVDHEQRGLFDKIVSELTYDQIEDVSGRVRGIGGTIFRYGELSVQTGNGKVKIMAVKIKHPLLLQEKINELRERYLNRSARDFSGNALNAVIDKLYELNRDELMRVKQEVEKIIFRNKSS
jgi:hypothetical protein